MTQVVMVMCGRYTRISLGYLLNFEHVNIKALFILDFFVSFFFNQRRFFLPSRNSLWLSSLVLLYITVSCAREPACRLAHCKIPSPLLSLFVTFGCAAAKRNKKTIKLQSPRGGTKIISPRKILTRGKTPRASCRTPQSQSRCPRPRRNLRTCPRSRRRRIPSPRAPR